jgi:hypothetical protein
MQPILYLWNQSYEEKMRMIFFSARLALTTVNNDIFISYIIYTTLLRLYFKFSCKNIIIRAWFIAYIHSSVLKTWKKTYECELNIWIIISICNQYIVFIKSCDLQFNFLRFYFSLFQNFHEITFNLSLFVISKSKYSLAFIAED